VQVDPIKSKLKPPGAKRLKLNCNILLSTSAFRLNLRRYNQVTGKAGVEVGSVDGYQACRCSFTLSHPR